MQIFSPSKFRIDRTTGSEVMAKKFICGQNNFLVINFEPVVRWIPNFEGAKICMVDGLFSNAVQLLTQKPGTLFTENLLGNKASGHAT